MADENTLERLLVTVRRIAEHRERSAVTEIRQTYSELKKDLHSFIAEEYARLAEDDKLTLDILRQKSEYARFMEEVVDKFDKVSPEVRNQVHSMCNDIYQKTYDGMVDAVKKSNNIESLNAVLKPIRAVTPTVVKAAIENPIPKLRLPKVLERNRKNIIADVKREITTGLTLGDRYSTMARRIDNVVGKGYKQAVRIARTEGHRVREKGFNDSANSVDNALKDNDAPFRMVKTWKTMKDGAVRNNRQINHQQMHGQAVLQDEEFTLSDGSKAKCPGHSGVAAQDINCRCYLSRKIMNDEEFYKATGRHFNEKSIAKREKSGIIKNIEKPVQIPDDCEYLLKVETNFDNKDISQEVLKCIDETIRNRLDEKHDFSFSEIKIARFNDANDKSVFITDGEYLGMRIINRLYLNKDYFENKTIEDFDKLCIDAYNKKWWKSKGLSDLVNHEIMHAKINTNNSLEKVERLYETLKDDERVKGFCRFVDMYPDEFMNEAYVVISRGEELEEKYKLIYDEYAKEFLGG